MKTKIHLQIIVIMGITILTGCNKREITASYSPETKAMIVTNILNFVFDDSNADGIPDGYKIAKKNGNKDATITCGKSLYCGKQVPIVTIYLPEEGSVNLDIEKPLKFEKDKSYLFVVDVKITDMSTYGKWYEKGLSRCLAFYVYGQNNRHLWSAISGNGNSDGWVTMMLPFDTIKHSDFTSSRIFMRCYKLSGKVQLRQPAIIEVPYGMKMKPHYILKDGTTVSGSFLRVQ